MGEISMSIRLAEYKDLEQMVKIYNQAIETHRCTADMDTFSVEERISWFEEYQCLEYPLYVYEIDNKVVGYLHFTGYRKGRRAMRYTAEISYYIHNDYQGQGIGTKMMEFALEKSKEWGYLPEVADFDGEVCSHLYYGLKI
ncbi:hypothetical protein CKR_0487 [Clostridium kluyveri NBRC 12016]|nr:hypothetical protein CKR_0487 [Clostridium kluyveri NBRC 12016]